MPERFSFPDRRGKMSFKIDFPRRGSRNMPPEKLSKDIFEVYQTGELTVVGFGGSYNEGTAIWRYWVFCRHPAVQKVRIIIISGACVGGRIGSSAAFQGVCSAWLKNTSASKKPLHSSRSARRSSINCVKKA